MNLVKVGPSGLEGSTGLHGVGCVAMAGAIAMEDAVAFLTQKELESMGFKYLGRDVLISEKASIYNASLIEIGDFSRIDDFCCVSGNVKIGRNVHIALGCNVAGGEPGIQFHDFSGLAYACNVFAQSDDYSGETLTNPTVPARFKKEIKKRVEIGRHCIVGAASIIFPGVELAEGTAVGAMSLVNKSTEAWSIYAGNRAKRLGPRKQDLLELERLYLKEGKQA